VLKTCRAGRRGDLNGRIASAKGRENEGKVGKKKKSDNINKERRILREKGGETPKKKTLAPGLSGH